MRTTMRTVWSFIVAAALAASASAQTPAAKVQPALDGVFEAFKTYPIVAMSDFHGLAQQQDVYAAVVRDPRFGPEVGNIVVEFGNAHHQAIIDRYVNGEDVPYPELRKVWADAIGWTPTPGYIGFANVFASVRAANIGLPKEQRIKLWLGDPPLDWTTATREGVQAAMRTRDSFPAALIADNILAKKKKTLLIYGGAHLSNDLPKVPRTTAVAGNEAAMRKLMTDVARGEPDYATMAPAFADVVKRGLAPVQADLASRGAITGVTFRIGDEVGRDVFDVTFVTGKPDAFIIGRDASGLINTFGIVRDNLRTAVERRYPGSFFYIAPYTGFEAPACEATFEQAHKDWPVPALVTGVRGSALAAEINTPACKAIRVAELPNTVLYLGPADRLTRSPPMPDLYMDLAFRAEISRHQPLRGQQALPAEPDMKTYSAAPAPWRAPPQKP